jgi:hypothetical protein
MSNAIGRVVIGVGPHKLSATIEVVDQQEKKLGNGRFTTDQAGNKAMRAYASTWPDRIWAVEGANGAGRPLAQRLLEAGENVVDIPAKLAARVRLFDTGHNRKTDALDAHSVARTRIKHTTITNKSDTSKCLRAAPARCLNCSTRRAKTRCLFTLPGPLSLAHSPWPTLPGPLCGPESGYRAEPATFLCHECGLATLKDATTNGSVGLTDPVLPTGDRCVGPRAASQHSQLG